MATAALSLADLEQFDAHAPDRGGRERRFACPLPACAGKPLNAEHRSLSVNTSSGAWRCARCGAAGKLRDFWTDRPPPDRRSRVRSSLRRAFSLSEPAALTPLPPPDQLDWRDQLRAVVPLAGTPAAEYLLGRGVPVDLAAASGTRFCSSWYWWPAVLFPIRDQAGALVAAQGRYLSNRSPRMRSAGAVSAGVFSTPGAWEAERLLITEAPIDALTLAGAGYPAIALAGATNLPHWLPQACAFREVVLALDGDEAGDRASDRLAAALHPLGAKVERLRPGWFKDWNALAPRLVEGLTVALAAALGGGNSDMGETAVETAPVRATEATEATEVDPDEESVEAAMVRLGLVRCVQCERILVARHVERVEGELRCWDRADCRAAQAIARWRGRR